MYAVAYGTSSTSPIIPVFRDRPPTPADTSPQYVQGQRWLDPVGNIEYSLMSFSTIGGQITSNWIALGNSTGTPLNTLTGNVGGAVSPILNNITVRGAVGTGALNIAGTNPGFLDATVLVDNSTITIVGNQLTAFNTALQTIGPTIAGAPFDALGAIIPIPPGSAYYFEADVIGSDGAALTHVVGGKQQAVIQNLGGVISILGLQNQFYAENVSVPSGQQDFEFVTAVGGAQFRVFGFMGVPMTFKAKISFVAIP